MAFKPITKLDVSRRLSDGALVSVGVLAQSRQGVFFEYDAGYLTQYGNLSPFMLQPAAKLHQAPLKLHQGLHGVFGDCLPDGWGLLLQDRTFRQHGILPAQITAMDRLAFIGDRGMGALHFSPQSSYQTSDVETDLATLGLQAQAVFDGQTDEVLSALVAAGSSGGARPKAQIYFPPGSPNECRTYSQPGDEAWLIKFTSQNLALGHEEGLCEAVYLQMAQQAGLTPPEWRLFDAPAKSGAKAWLAVRRFDWVNNGPHQSAGRLHMHSACGLLDADFRSPSLDYETLIKASRQLCRSPAVGQLQFCRAIFNLFSSNQDDHSKNWAFLQADDGQWQPAPFYDITFSPHPFDEHATAFAGFGNKPPLKTMQKMAQNAGFGSWKAAQQRISEIADVIAEFPILAQQLEVSPVTIKGIEQVLQQRRKENSILLQAG